MTQYGPSSRKRPPPVSDHQGLTYWVVAYGRFHCIIDTSVETRVLLYRHECSTGKYIDTSGLCFRVASVVFVYIIKRTLHVRSKIGILRCSHGKNNIMFCHSNITFISSRHRAISSMYPVTVTSSFHFMCIYVSRAGAYWLK